MGRCGHAVLGVAICLCAWPATANAAVTCSFDAGSGEVSIEMDADGDSVTLEVGAADRISAFEGATDVCLAAGPTLDNAEHIGIEQQGVDQDGTLAINVSRPFTGGLGPEGAGPEIEITADLGTGLDRAYVRSEPSIGEWHVGALANVSAALNLNPRDEPGHLDGDDVVLSNVLLTLERPGFMTPTADTQPNLIDASGTSEFTGPLAIPLAVIGWEGPDTVIASAAGARLAGGAGDDVLKAAAGPDRLFGGVGGTDTMDYSRGGAGVSVDLDLDGQDQNTGGSGLDMVSDVENLIGSPFADTLIGTTGPNRIEPGLGADTVAALAGADVIPAVDATRDAINCGADLDTVQADARLGRPVDLLGGCESVAFTDPTPPDLRAPITTFTKRPTKKVRGRKAKFGFFANEAGVSFKCALDGGLFRPCRSPETVRKLKPGKHKLKVRGTDPSGNIEAKPAVAGFRVAGRGGRGD